MSTLWTPGLFSSVSLSRLLDRSTRDSGPGWWGRLNKTGELVLSHLGPPFWETRTVMGDVPGQDIGISPGPVYRPLSLVGARSDPRVRRDLVPTAGDGRRPVGRSFLGVRKRRLFHTLRGFLSAVSRLHGDREPSVFVGDLSLLCF